MTCLLQQLLRPLPVRVGQEDIVALVVPRHPPSRQAVHRLQEVLAGMGIPAFFLVPVGDEQPQGALGETVGLADTRQAEEPAHGEGQLQAGLEATRARPARGLADVGGGVDAPLPREVGLVQVGVGVQQLFSRPPVQAQGGDISVGKLPAQVADGGSGEDDIADARPQGHQDARASLYHTSDRHRSSTFLLSRITLAPSAKTGGQGLTIDTLSPERRETPSRLAGLGCATSSLAGSKAVP